MPKIYFYKMTCDDGGAPCVTKRLLSLAICKPKMRKTADVGDILIGFAANKLHRDNRVLYIAKVTCKLSNGRYYSDKRYAARPDCIYKWLNGKLVVRGTPQYHGSKSGLVHDVGNPPDHERGAVLLSRKFIYWGVDGSDRYKKNYPAIANALMRLTRGHRVNHSEKLTSELETFIRGNSLLNRARVLGKPTSRPSRGACHDDGCGYVEAPDREEC